MNILSLISAVVLSAITPVSLPNLPGVKEGRAIIVDDVAVVAVIPEACYGLEQKSETLRSATEMLSKEWDKEVVLTEDLLTYMTIARMEKRGVNDYERKSLAGRLSRVKSYCYTSQKAG